MSSPPRAPLRSASMGYRYPVYPNAGVPAGVPVTASPPRAAAAPAAAPLRTTSVPYGVAAAGPRVVRGPLAGRPSAAFGGPIPAPFFADRGSYHRSRRSRHRPRGYGGFPGFGPAFGAPIGYPGAGFRGPVVRQAAPAAQDEKKEGDNNAAPARVVSGPRISSFAFSNPAFAPRGPVFAPGFGPQFGRFGPAFGGAPYGAPIRGPAYPAFGSPVRIVSRAAAPAGDASKDDE